MKEIQPNVLYDAISSNDTQKSQEVILELKSQVKHGQINLVYAKRYFDILIVAYRNPRLQISSFSTICHLIKLIRIKQPSSLTSVHQKIVPFLFEKLKEGRESLRSASMKAMVTIWESIPDIFEEDLRAKGFRNPDPVIRRRLLEMIAEISKNSPGFSLESFLPNIIHMLSDQVESVAQASTKLLVLYYNNISSSSETASRAQLVELLAAHHIPHSISLSLLSKLDNNASLMKLYRSKMISHVSRPSSRARNPYRYHAKSVQSSSGSSLHYNNNLSIATGPLTSYVPDSGVLDNISNSSIIKSLLSEYDDFRHMDELHSLAITSEQQLMKLSDKLKLPFEGKETEQNWIKRVKAIKTFQSILRGNCISEYSQLLSQVLGGSVRCINKAAQSLRTTLSSAACQLCKEIFISLGPKLVNSTVDALMISLIKLSSSLKTITRQKANLAIVAIILYTNFNPKVVTQIYSSSLEKNIQSRAYASFWAELFLLRYAGDDNVVEGSFGYIIKIIERGIQDPSPLVREASRRTYWSLYKIFPDKANSIMSELPRISSKALEKARVSSYERYKHPEILDQAKPMSTSRIGSVESSFIRSSSPVSLASPPPVQSTGLTEQKLVNSSNRKEISISRVSSRQSSRDHNSQGSSSLEEYTEILKKQNIIYDEILSSNLEIQEKGFKLLLSTNNGQLPVKFSSALNKLSVVNPKVMLQVFDNQSTFKKVTACLTTDNIVRLCCFYILEQHPDVKLVNEIIFQNIPMDELCLGLTSVMNLCIDSSKIQDVNLSFQFAKYKKEFAEASFGMVSSLLDTDKIKVENYLLSSLFDALLGCWEFTAHSSGTKYITALKLALAKSEPIFRKCVGSIEDSAIKGEIETNLSLVSDKSVHPDQVLTSSQNERDIANADGLTMVLRKDIKKAQVPSKVETDLTLIMPKFNNTKQNLVTSKATISDTTDKTENVFLDDKQDANSLSNMTVDDIFDTKTAANVANTNHISETSIDASQMDVDETSAEEATVNMHRLSLNDTTGTPTKKSPTKKSAIKSFNELTDPLAKLTPSADKVEIYEDDFTKRKAKPDSWIDFANYKASQHRKIQECGPEIANKLLSKMDQGDISFDELIELVYNLEANSISPERLVDHILKISIKGLKSKRIFAILLLLRACISRSPGHKNKEIFMLIVKLSSKVHHRDELYFAIEEAAESTKSISGCLEALELKGNQRLDSLRLEIVLEALLRIIDPKSVSYEDIFMLDSILYRQFSSEVTEVRKVTVMIYAKLFQYMKENVKSSDGDQLVDKTIFSKLDQFQLNLVKHYSQRI